MSASVIYGYDSFKSGTSLTNLTNARWSVRNDSTPKFSLNATGGRFGGQSLQYNGTNNYNAWIQKAIANQATLYLHFPLWVDAIVSSYDQFIAGFLDGATLQVSLALTPGGVFRLYRSTGTVLATASVGPGIGTYHVMELKVTFSGSVGVYELRMDGVSIIGPTSSANTSGSGNAYANAYFLGPITGNNPQGTWQYEHIICADDYFNIYDKRFFTRLPNSASSTQWTPNASTNLSQIQEAQQDADTSYNSDSTVGHVDLFGLPATPSGLQNIFAIMTSAWARKDDAGVRSICNQVSSGGTGLDGTTDVLGTDYREFIDILYNDPHTSAAWTKSSADAMLQGYKLVA